MRIKSRPAWNTQQNSFSRKQSYKVGPFNCPPTETISKGLYFINRVSALKKSPGGTEGRCVGRGSESPLTLRREIQNLEIPSLGCKGHTFMQMYSNLGRQPKAHCKALPSPSQTEGKHSMEYHVHPHLGDCGLHVHITS